MTSKHCPQTGSCYREIEPDFKTEVGNNRSPTDRPPCRELMQILFGGEVDSEPSPVYISLYLMPIGLRMTETPPPPRKA